MECGVVRLELEVHRYQVAAVPGSGAEVHRRHGLVETAALVLEFSGFGIDPAALLQATVLRYTAESAVHVRS